MFSSLQSLQSSENCVLCVKHFFHQGTPPTDVTTPVDSDHGNSEPPPPPSSCPILCSTSTDGHVAVWSIQPFLSDWIQRHVPPPLLAEQSSQAPAPPMANFKIHQSGINDLAIQTDATHLEGVSVHALASVGDDNALALTHLTVSTECGGIVSVRQDNKHAHFMAHSSAITGKLMSRHSCNIAVLTGPLAAFTGVCFAGKDLVMTTSIDQRLNVWKVNEEGGIELSSSHTHDVADPSSLATYSTR